MKMEEFLKEIKLNDSDLLEVKNALPKQIISGSVDVPVWRLVCRVKFYDGTKIDNKQLYMLKDESSWDLIDVEVTNYVLDYNKTCLNEEQKIFCITVIDYDFLGNVEIEINNNSCVDNTINKQSEQNKIRPYKKYDEVQRLKVVFKNNNLTLENESKEDKRYNFKCNFNGYVVYIGEYKGEYFSLVWNPFDDLILASDLEFNTIDEALQSSFELIEKDIDIFESSLNKISDLIIKPFEQYKK